MNQNLIMVTFDKIGGAHQFHSMIYAVAATTPQCTAYGQHSPHFYEAPRSTLMVYPIQDPMSSAFIIGVNYAEREISLIFSSNTARSKKGIFLQSRFFIFLNSINAFIALVYQFHLVTYLSRCITVSSNKEL